MQTPKRNLYGYAPKQSRQGTTLYTRKLSELDKNHIKQWFAMGYTRIEIARAYDVSYRYVALIVGTQKRK
jgi:hypothetical protein